MREPDLRMIMKFSMNEWLKMYNEVHALGTKLRDSRPTYDDEGGYIAPKTELTKDVQSRLEFQIQSLTERSNRYLDQCKLKMPRPLWYYIHKEPETHASDKRFKYAHLMA